MNDKSRQIHDMIQTFETCGESNGAVTSRLLDILQRINERMDAIENTATQAANTASCLANGINPD